MMRDHFLIQKTAAYKSGKCW